MSTECRREGGQAEVLQWTRMGEARPGCGTEAKALEQLGAGGFLVTLGSSR